MKDNHTPLKDNTTNPKDNHTFEGQPHTFEGQPHTSEEDNHISLKDNPTPLKVNHIHLMRMPHTSEGQPLTIAICDIAFAVETFERRPAFYGRPIVVLKAKPETVDNGTYTTAITIHQSTQDMKI